MEATIDPPPRRLGRLQVIWPLLIAGLIFSASTRSAVAAPHVTNIDKVAHFSVYGLLGTLICRLRGGGSGALMGLLIASAYGATDEWHQYFVPGRSCDVWDWVADTSGAALAVTLYAGWSWYRELLEMVLWPRRRRIVAASAGAGS
jgi:VanZ family protein